MSALVAILATVLVLMVIAGVAWRMAMLHAALRDERDAHRRTARDVDELATWARTARWVVANVHDDDLDDLIAEHTPPPRKNTP